MDEEPDLKYARDFARLSQELHRDFDEAPTLERIAVLAVQTITGCDYCAVSVRQADGMIQTLASTDPVVTRSDELQCQFGEGPCLDVIWDLDTCLVPDLESDSRWPLWGPRAAELGIGSILSLKLESPVGSPLAGLNLYAKQTHAFDHSDLAIASIFARHAGTALYGARTYAGIHAAMRSRQAIGVAQGILMQRFGLTLDQSFEVLRRYSQTYNVKLKILAERLVQLGSLPPGDLDADQDPLQKAFGLTRTGETPDRSSRD